MEQGKPTQRHEKAEGGKQQKRVGDISNRFDSRQNHIYSVAGYLKCKCNTDRYLWFAVKEAV